MVKSKLFSFAFKKIFKSWFCWSVLFITVVVFFMTIFGVINLSTRKPFGTKIIDRCDIRLWMSFFTFWFLSISMSNLAQFIVDKQNLIFIISKHYERLKVISIKLLFFALFSLIFVIFLIIDAYILNLYATQKFHVYLWNGPKDFLIHFCLQISLLMIYNILFWSIIALYFNPKIFAIIVFVSQFFTIFLYYFIGPMLEKILNKDISNDYVLFVKEILLNNLFFCPISLVTFTFGISCFYKMDLRI